MTTADKYHKKNKNTNDNTVHMISILPQRHKFQGSWKNLINSNSTELHANLSTFGHFSDLGKFSPFATNFCTGPMPVYPIISIYCTESNIHKT